MKAGLKTFGEKGADAVEKEMRQLHDMGILDTDGNLQNAEKRAALTYVI